MMSDSFADKLRRLVLSATISCIYGRKGMEEFFSNLQTQMFQLVLSVMKVLQFTCSWPKAPRSKENLELILEWGLANECLRN